MSKFQKVKKSPNPNIHSGDQAKLAQFSSGERDTIASSQEYSNTKIVSNSGNKGFCMICPIPEIAKIQIDTNSQNIYILVFMSEDAIYQKYKTTHTFEILKPNIQETFHFFSYFFHFQLPKTIQPFFCFDPNLECEINSNQREYVIIGWIVRCGIIIGILYVQMYNQICQNFNVLIIEDCPFICFLGSLTHTFFGLFLNNIRIVQTD